MKHPKTSELPSIRKILRKLERVRKAADIASRNKSRFADYRYLRAVLRAHSYFDDNSLIPRLLEMAPSVLNIPCRANWHPLRVIIESTCIQPDLQMRSRWTRALQYALVQKISPDELPQFLKANSGIAGCAELATYCSRNDL